MTCFDFYGVHLKVDGGGDFEPLQESLREDFHFFSVKSLPRVAVDISICWSRSPMKRPVLPLVLKTPLVRAYGFGSRRWVDYGDGITLFSEEHEGFKRVEVRGPISPLLYEAIYDFILSSVGERLDGMGFHRIHALGFERNNEASLLVLPSGSGKSAMAVLLMQDPEIRIYSDEMPLVRHGKVYPFPIRIALRESVARALGVNSNRRFVRKLTGEKLLFTLAKDRIARPRDVKFLFFKDLIEHGSPKKAGRASAFLELSAPLIVGWGIAQMREHMLRVGLAPQLPQIAFSRTKEALRLVSQAEAYRLPWQTMAQKNCETLKHHFRKILN